MAAPDLGECAGFVWDLQRSGLLDRSRLDQVVGDFLAASPGADAHAMAEYLIQSGDLSPFQVETLLSGKAQDLVLNDYVLIEAIGQGSMGTVYKAVNRHTGHEYALKLLPRRSMWNVRIARRIIRAFENEHPSVVAFRDVGTAGASHFLAWDLAQGEPLDDRVKRLAKLAPGVAARYGLHIAEGLHTLHGQGVVHGLIKPSNVLVTDEHHARILDFGIGALLSEAKEESLVDTMSMSNTVTAGLDCRSPETILEPTLRTPAGDQYSLGCVLYFCLVGRFPFHDMSAVQKMMAHQTQEPPPIRDTAPYVPKALVTIIERLMKKNPEERYSGFDEAAEALRPLAVDAKLARQLTKMPPGSAMPAAVPDEVVDEPYEPEEVPEAEAQATDTAEAYVPGAEPEPAETHEAMEEPQGAEPWVEEEPVPEVDGTPSMMDALGRDDAFEEVLPLPKPGQRSSLDRRHRRSGASLGARLGAALLGYVIGAAVVGGAIWFLYTQGYLPQ
jgi:serine/threonine protein kinase